MTAKLFDNFEYFKEWFDSNYLRELSEVTFSEINKILEKRQQERNGPKLYLTYVKKVKTEFYSLTNKSEFEAF